jgi:methyl-accepting chemotaxis protein
LARRSFRDVVEIGGEIVELLVTALRDHTGVYLGPMLTWEIKTEQVRLQRQNEAMAQERQRQAEIERKRVEDEAIRDRRQAEMDQQRIAEEAERDRAAAHALQVKIDALLQAVDQAAKGDLRQHLEVDGDDAVSKVGGALDVLFADLRSSIAEIARNADELSNSSTGLRASSNSMFAAAETTTQELANVVTATCRTSRLRRTN